MTSPYALRWSSALALGASLSVTAPAWADTVESLMDHGPTHNRVNLAVLGDGYTAAEQDALSADARAMLDTLFSFSPYKEYKGLFNAKLVHVVSNQSGISNDPKGTVRDTALAASFHCQGVERVICLDDAKVLGAAAKTVPNYTLILVVVNSITYGGAGGQYAVVSRNQASADILRHELGHSLGSLADEYDSPYPGYSACPVEGDCPEPNATVHADRHRAKWAHWIGGATPIPTPPGSTEAIGVFEGARYEKEGVFRPVDSACIMHELSHGFCPVCAEAMVSAFWSRVSPIDDTSPSESVTATSCEPTTLKVMTPPLGAGTLRFAWTVDGRPLDARGAELDLQGAQLAVGHHGVDVEVEDATQLVREDPKGYLHANAHWDVDVRPCGAAGVGAAQTAGVTFGNERDGGATRRAGGCQVDPVHLAGTSGGAMATLALGALGLLARLRRARTRPTR